MPVFQTSEQELIGLFNDLKSKTEGFKTIEPEVLSSNPRMIKVFRMLLSMSLYEMGQLVKRSYATISQYERQKIRNIPMQEAGRMLGIIKANLPSQLDQARLIQNLMKFKEKSRGGILQALRRAEKMKPTEQESILRDVLTKIGVPFRQHATLDTDIGPLNFDFIIQETVVVECTESKSKWKAESLGYRAIKVRNKYPRMKLIAVIPKNVNGGFRRRLTDYDLVIELDDVNSLLPVIDLLFTKPAV